MEEAKALMAEAVWCWDQGVTDQEACYKLLRVQ